jgi:hypothetical protein
MELVNMLESLLCIALVLIEPGAIADLLLEASAEVTRVKFRIEATGVK